MFPNNSKSVKNMSGIALATLTLIGGLSVASPAYADVDPVSSSHSTTQIALSSEDKASLEEFFNKAKIPSDVQSRLMKKLESGVPWDSISGANPVSTETLDDNEFIIKKLVYAENDWRSTV